MQPVCRGAGENQHRVDEASWVKSAGQSPFCARHLGRMQLWQVPSRSHSTES